LQLNPFKHELISLSHHTGSSLHAKPVRKRDLDYFRPLRS